MKLDLDDLERKARERTAISADVYLTTDDVTVALIARIQKLEAFVDAIPDEFLQAGKLGREEAPELFTDDDGNAIYMDEAKRRILDRGAVLL